MNFRAKTFMAAMTVIILVCMAWFSVWQYSRKQVSLTLVGRTNLNGRIPHAVFCLSNPDRTPLTFYVRPVEVKTGFGWHRVFDTPANYQARSIAAHESFTFPVAAPGDWPAWRLTVSYSRPLTRLDAVSHKLCAFLGIRSRFGLRHEISNTEIRRQPPAESSSHGSFPL